VKKGFRYFLLYLLSLSPIFGDSQIFLLSKFDEFGDNYSISSEKLQKDFIYLKRNGYKVVSLQYLLENREKEKLVSFTVDGGYSSFYEIGLPLFREFNFPFTLFISSRAIKRKYPNFMSWKQIKRASQFGEIAVHGYSTTYLTSLEPIYVMREVQKSIRTYTKNLSVFPKYFSYPYGAYNKTVQDIVSAFYFEGIFHQSRGAISEKSEIVSLPRIPLFGEEDISSLLKTEFLEVEWIEPNEFPKDWKLRKIRAKLSPEISSIQLYVSGFTWRVFPVKNGILEAEFEEPIKLKYGHTRIFLKTFDNKWGNLDLLF
jgi:peptidoglycan/xylan/chitin deacetylase (PgdA/CDA1 family)